MEINSPNTLYGINEEKNIANFNWKLKDKNIPFETTWGILKPAPPYTPSTKRCNLCTWEKYYITTAEKDKILNSRSELISTCRHRRKFLLSEYG